MTTAEVRALLAAPPVAALLPVGSTEPHGPHLPLATDVIISEVACERAVGRLEAAGIGAVIAPSVPYGVTDYAAGFAGAIGVPAAALTAFLRAVVERLLGDGFTHVCLVNNHLEPAHDAAVRAAIEGLPAGAASVACPLTRRWGRTLSAEFKSGACHAGRYETSLVLAADRAVRASYKDLPSLDVSLSRAILEGKATFAEIGMPDAYTGAPSEATSAEGDALYERLAEMVVREVSEAAGAG
ncbi:MAG: creatininase family protein [Myxococcales bacterium]|nr:creatininase family protein [Myxococcales bacterium]